MHSVSGWVRERRATSLVARHSPVHLLFPDNNMSEEFGSPQPPSTRIESGIVVHSGEVLGCFGPFVITALLLRRGGHHILHASLSQEVGGG